MYQCANGFLCSYTSLITHESDYHMARDLHLVPSSLS